MGDRGDGKGEVMGITGTWRLLTAHLTICLRLGAFHSLMRRSARMWRSPVLWIYKAGRMLEECRQSTCMYVRCTGHLALHVSSAQSGQARG